MCLLWFNFILGLKFYFPLFWGILMYDNEFKTWSCDNFITRAMLFMALHAVQGRIQDFFRRGCTRLLLYFNTNKPHSFLFGRIPVVLENRRSSRAGGGAHPLHPPPRSAPAVACMRDCSMTFLMLNFNSVKNSSCCKK